MPNKIEVGQNVLLKNQRREDRKGGKFSIKWLGPYTVHAILDKNFCSLINKDGKELKTNVSLLKPYVDADKIEVFDEKPPFRENTDPSKSIDDEPSAGEEVDSSNSTDEKPLIIKLLDNTT